MSQKLSGRQKEFETTISLLEVSLTLLFATQVSDTLLLPPSNRVRRLEGPQAQARAEGHEVHHAQGGPEVSGPRLHAEKSAHRAIAEQLGRSAVQHGSSTGGRAGVVREPRDPAQGARAGASGCQEFHNGLADDS